MSVRILAGHVLTKLRDLPDESVHCVVTSPPYYGLRDYGIEPQMWPDGWRGSFGLEPTLDLYLDHMVEVCREIRRVMRSDATCWMNLGDSYSNKQLQLIPSRLAIRLQDDGWYVRSEIIWAKSAPMPESVTDRPTCAHEKIWLLTKSAKYFWDAEAVKEEAEGVESDGSAGNRHRFSLPGTKDIHEGRTERYQKYRPGMRNMRNVWHLSPSPYPEAHFATFPPELPRRCIMAGTSERGVCPRCAAPWARVIRKDERKFRTVVGDTHNLARIRPDGRCGLRLDGLPETETIGWRATCSCDAGVPVPATCLDPFAGAPVPATILDCFAGAGTTLMVADQLQRNAIGIELSPKYVAMMRARIERDAGMFVDIAAD